MEYLARKINPAKWELKEPMECSSEDSPRVPANAITGGCLRTKDNSLSFWEVERKDINKVALALSSARQRIEKLQIVLIPREEFPSPIFNFSKKNRVNTPFTNFKDKHIDMINIDMACLCQVAYKIAPKIKMEEFLIQYTKKDIKKIIIKGIKDGDIEIEYLDECILKDLNDGIKDKILSNPKRKSCKYCKQGGKCLVCEGRGWIPIPPMENL